MNGNVTVKTHAPLDMKNLTLGLVSVQSDARVNISDIYNMVPDTTYIINLLCTEPDVLRSPDFQSRNKSPFYSQSAGTRFVDPPAVPQKGHVIYLTVEGWSATLFPSNLLISII